MKILYVPLYRMAASYTVNFGRRWSLLEHLLLVELSTARRSVAELSQLASLPERLVVEALINLVRANWVEVRATNDAIFFAATALGKRRAAEENLPSELQTSVRWMSVCVDRLTGAWLRADDLDLVYERDMPHDAVRIEPRVQTFDPSDGSLRDLVTLAQDEALEPVEPQFRNPSRPYARMVVAFDELQDGLPIDAPMGLRQAIIDAASSLPDVPTGDRRFKTARLPVPIRDEIQSQDIIVGGPEHLATVRGCLERAESHVILHSCFVSPDTVRQLLPDFAKAAQRKVRVDLLWGLVFDPEDRSTRKPITDSQKVLDELPQMIKSRVQLSPESSRSHAKILIYDDKDLGQWVSIVGSCNFLLPYVPIDISLRSRSQHLAGQLLNRLIAAQIPPSGSWSPVARRLARSWESIRRKAMSGYESGPHTLTLIADQDHYACVTAARDQAKESIVIGCDLYGAAAPTSVLVPMSRAAELGRRVRLLYRRLSKHLREQGKVVDTLGRTDEGGVRIETADDLHGKFLLWDDDALAITSFNWMATVVEGTRSRGAELGVLVKGPALRTALAGKLAAASNGKILIVE